MEVPQKIKDRTTIRSSNSTPGYLSKKPKPKQKTLTRKDICTPMFTAALFTIAKTWKQPKCPPKDEWIKKLWYINTVEYSAIKKKENLAICSNMDGP